jgi:hypothetical protein
MVSLDWEVANPTIRLKRKEAAKVPKGSHPQSNVSEDVDICKEGENDMPF